MYIYIYIYIYILVFALHSCGSAETVYIECVSLIAENQTDQRTPYI